MRYFGFISMVLVALLTSAVYIGARVTMRIPWANKHRLRVWVGLVLFICFQFFGTFLYRKFPNDYWATLLIQWAVYSSLGLYVCGFIYLLTCDGLTGIWRMAVRKKPSPVDLQRRSVLTAGALAMGTTAIGTIQAATGPHVFEVEIPLEHLPPEFDGYRIVQLTDLHVGPLIGADYVKQVVAMAKELSPHLFVLTGDFVDGTVAQLRTALEPLGGLASEHGVFFITGNHEYYWEVQSWVAAFQEMGIRVLLNEHVVLRRQQGEIVLAGVTDYLAGLRWPDHNSDPVKALSGAPAGALKIMLAHQPKSFRAVEEAGAHLQLSGHTHGGQFFPWNLVVKFAQPFYKGLNRYKNMWIYVSRGTGFWGPPMRFAVPSEITHITLRRASPLS